MDTYANVTIETTMRKLAVAISLATRFVIILDNDMWHERQEPLTSPSCFGNCFLNPVGKRSF